MPITYQRMQLYNIHYKLKVNTETEKMWFGSALNNNFKKSFQIFCLLMQHSSFINGILPAAIMLLHLKEIHSLQTAHDKYSCSHNNKLNQCLNLKTAESTFFHAVQNSVHNYRWKINITCPAQKTKSHPVSSLM